MREITIKPGEVVTLGFQGETGATQIRFDVSGWAEEYGEGVFQLVVRAPGSADAYTAAIAQEGDFVLWTVMAEDTAVAGSGYCQLEYYVDTALAKSCGFRTLIAWSVGPSSGYASDAEAWAIGERDGEPVQETDETYHNNAKYYAGEAEASAEQAAASADSALETVRAAGTEQVQRVQAAGETQLQAIGDMGATQKAAVVDEGSTQVQRVQTAGDAAAESTAEDIQTAGAAQIQSIDSAAADQLQAIGDMGAAQKAAVVDEGSTQVQRVQAAGDQAATGVEASIETQGNAQIQRVQDAAGEQIAEITQEGSDQRGAVADAGTAEIQRIQTVGAQTSDAIGDMVESAEAAQATATQSASDAEAARDAAAQSAAAAQTAAERDVPAAAAAWLSEHVDPETGYVIDNSLSIQGAAADAEAAGERISQLETGRYALSAADAASIPNGTDYDTLKTVGNYRVTSAAAAASMQNCPVAVAHRLFVESLNTSARYLQTIFAAAASVPEWRRFWDGTTWSAWRHVAYEDTIPPAVIQWNSVDVFASNTAADRTAAGITYTNNHDGTWMISGTATGTSFCNIVGNTTVIPTGIVPGRSYRLSLNGGSVPVRFYLYNGEAYTIVNAASDRSIKIPDNCTGVIARFQIAAGQTVDETVRYTLITEAERAVDSNGWLESVDMSTQDEADKTDRAPEIMAMLQDDGFCHLGPGIFYVSGIDMPIHSTLCGCGDATQIRLLASVTDGYCIKAKEYCTIKDLGLSGSYSQLSPTTNGHRDGIRFASNYDGTEGDTQSTTKHCMIDNVWIRNFRGSGILCHNSSISVSRGLYVTNAYIFQCWAGINIDYRSEFNKFANVCAASCYYACINNGGNNVFSACTFHATYTAFYIDGTQPNSGHGTITGCTFCHTGSNNGVAIKMDNVADGFVIAGCQIWYNSVEITNSTGVLFDSCEFGRGISSDGSVCASITVTGGRLVLFSGCMFHMDVARPPKITITNNSKVRFSGCYGTESGELISA